MNTSPTTRDAITVTHAPSWMGAVRTLGLSQHDPLLAAWIGGMARGIGDVGVSLTRTLNSRGPAARDAQHITQLLHRHGLLAVTVDTDTDTGRASVQLTIPERLTAVA